jgi:hypothetical protein
MVTLLLFDATHKKLIVLFADESKLLFEDMLKANVATTKSLQWCNIQQRLIDICIALSPLDLPPYVLLEIIDWLPHWATCAPHSRKIEFIIRFRKCCARILSRREPFKLLLQ